MSHLTTAKESNAWEQRSAASLFIESVDKNHPSLPVLSATKSGSMVDRRETGRSISYDRGSAYTYKRVLPGQFVIHLRSFQSGFAHSAITGITSPAYTIFGLSKVAHHDDRFWKIVFGTSRFTKSLEAVTYGIRDGRSISYSEFLTMSFAYPLRTEQTKIAQALWTLDKTITLHQREQS